MSDFDSMKKRLEEEYKENGDAMIELNKKIRAYEVNDFDYRFQSTFALGAFPWIGAVLATPILMKTGLSTEILHLLQAGIPIGIGVAGERAFTKHREMDVRLEEFSDAKTQREMVLERTKCKIEKECLIALNKVLRKTYESIESKEALLHSLDGEYNVSRRDTNNVVDRNVQIEKLRKLLEDAKEKVRVAATQCFLRDEFYKYRYRFFGNSDIFLYSMLGFVGGLGIIAGPALRAIVPDVPTSGWVGLEMFASATGACIGTATYLVHKNRNYTKVFLECNEALGDHKLPETIHHDHERDYEQDYYDRVLEKVIGDAVEIRLRLEEEITLKEAEDTAKELDSAQQTLEKIHGVSVVDPVTLEQHISLGVDEVPVIDTDKKLNKTYPSGGDK